MKKVDGFTVDFQGPEDDDSTRNPYEIRNTHPDYEHLPAMVSNTYSTTCPLSTIFKRRCEKNKERASTEQE